MIVTLAVLLELSPALSAAADDSGSVVAAIGKFAAVKDGLVAT